MRVFYCFKHQLRYSRDDISLPPSPVHYITKFRTWEYIKFMLEIHYNLHDVKISSLLYAQIYDLQTRTVGPYLTWDSTIKSHTVLILSRKPFYSSVHGRYVPKLLRGIHHVPRKSRMTDPNSEYEVIPPITCTYNICNPKDRIGTVRI
jgi:hypothetical protein